MTGNAARHAVGPVYARLYRARTVLLLAFAAAIVLRFSLLGVGSPFLTIDDSSAFNGGFMVWFGQAPPQRMYLESWIIGLSCLLTYTVKLLTGGVAGGAGVNFIADAYRDYYANPDLYVQGYRALIVLVDMATAYLVYRIGRLVTGDTWRGLAAALAAILFLFSYNTFWSGMVARPDSLVAFFAMLGLYAYFRSDYGRDTGWLVLAAIVLGLAAGMKLHGAFFTIFLLVDLVRVHGLRRAAGRAGWLAGLSFVFFCMGSGSLLFDPMTYIKLRVANMHDDASPWIVWGEQFVVILKGSGWLAVPATLAAAWMVFTRKSAGRAADDRIRSVILLAVLWLLLFAMIRQLRAYWMLPVLPLFYIAAMYFISHAGMHRLLAVSFTALMTTIVAVQGMQQISAFHATPYNELRDWVHANIHDEPFYIFGYEALTLPKNTACIRRHTEILERKIAGSLQDGMPFTLRHLQNWEERSQLLLYDMLGMANEPGYEYYSFYGSPLETGKGIVNMDDMQYLLLQEHFPLEDVAWLEDYIARHFRLLAELTGAGGGGSGLRYRVFGRI